MNYTPVFLILLAFLSFSCKKECRKVIKTYPAGNEKIVHTYPDCNDTSKYLYQYFFWNGQIGCEGMKVNGLNEGIFRTWTIKGVLTAKWDNRRGKEHGFVECWYDNGRKKREVNLQMGLRHGKYTDWDTLGNLEAEGFYKNDKKEGIWKFYNRYGQCMTRNYLNDTLQGYTHEHLVDSTGKVTIVTGTYKNGEETGLWKWFDKDSLLFRTSVYKNGKLHGENIRYYANGKPNIIEEFENDSLIKCEAAFDIDGNPTLINGNGTIKTYHDNRAVAYEGTYVNSKRTGICKWFHDNGQLDQTVLYNNELRMEVLNSFDRNGNKQDPGTLKGGNGTWIIYDENGEIEKTYYFENGMKIKEEFK